jgi:hypothetical protein
MTHAHTKQFPSNFLFIKIISKQGPPYWENDPQRKNTITSKLDKYTPKKSFAYKSSLEHLCILFPLYDLLYNHLYNLYGLMYDLLYSHIYGLYNMVYNPYNLQNMSIAYCTMGFHGLYESIEVLQLLLQLVRLS